MDFRIENMTCGGCARGVTKAIQGSDANAKVDARPADRMVKVETNLTCAQVEQALAAAGFPASGPE